MHTLHDPGRTILAFPLDLRNAGRTTEPSEQNRQGVGVGKEGDVSGTLTDAFVPGVIAFHNRGNIGDGSDTGVTFGLTGASHGNHGMVVANETGHERWTEEEVAGSLNAHEAKEAHTVIFKPSHYTRGKDGAPSEISPPLSADADKGDQDPLIFAMRGREAGNVPEVSTDGNVSAIRGSSGGSTRDMVVAGTLQSCYRGVPSTEETIAGRVQATAGVPRRLTPRECERLMGWPDDWTLVEKAGKPLSESARYRLCGNGVVKNVTWWIGERLPK